MATYHPLFMLPLLVGQQTALSDQDKALIELIMKGLDPEISLPIESPSAALRKELGLTAKETEDWKTIRANLIIIAFETTKKDAKEGKIKDSEVYLSTLQDAIFVAARDIIKKQFPQKASNWSRLAAWSAYYQGGPESIITARQFRHIRLTEPQRSAIRKLMPGFNSELSAIRKPDAFPPLPVNELARLPDLDRPVYLSYLAKVKSLLSSTQQTELDTIFGKPFHIDTCI